MYRISVDIKKSSIIAPNSPVEVDLDFDRLLPGIDVQPGSIKILLNDRPVPYRLSDHFRYGNHGKVYFVVNNPDDLRYFLTIEEGKSESPVVPSYIPAVGIGDPIHYNAGRLMPLPMKMGPQINDLEGDGTAHLTMGTHWTTYYGWPQNVLFHRTGVENKGSFEFGPVAAVRCRKKEGAKPEIISEDFYIRHHIVDWDADGRLDLVTVNSGVKEMKFYRNTGEPGPVFRYIASFRAEETEGYLGVRLVDLFNDGRRHLVIGGNEHLPGQEKAPYTSYIQWYENLSDPGRIPRFASPKRFKLEDGLDVKFEGAGWNFVFADLDGDGKLDLLYDRSGHEKPLVWYRNLGPCGQGGKDKGSPVFRMEGEPEGIEMQPGSSVGLGWADYGGEQGPIINGSIYRFRIDPDRKSPVFHSPRQISGVNPEIDGGGQAWPHPCDWDGDGDLDLLAGDGRGYIQLFENTGTRKHPEFKGAERIQSCGEDIRIWRDDVLGGRHWHGMTGYTTPVYADWDGDGIPDLVVANETNRIFWYRNEGTGSNPVFGPRQQIEVDGFEDSAEKRELSRRLSSEDVPNSPYPYQADEAFFWRQKAAVVDWHGDGLPALVAVDGDGHYCLFERYRDSDGTLRLRKAFRFKYENGTPVTHNSLPRETTGTDAVTVCDWQGRGVWDILVGTCYTIFYLENQGTNRNPVFALPVRLKLWGKEIRHSRHGLNGHAVDWDGDGCLSWLCGSESGMFFLFRRAALDADAPPEVVVSRS